MSRTLSTREKWLAIIVGGVLFVFANVFLVQRFVQRESRLRADIAAKTKQLQHMQSLTEDLAFSELRDTWLQAKQPKLTNPDTAGVQLLNQIKDLAKQHSVLLENPAIRLPDRQAAHVSISVEVETKSSWKPLIAFLHDLQNPEQFIAVESANLKIDDTDATKMHGRFRIGRWYAPR
jgi:hypothetical protein